MNINIKTLLTTMLVLMGGFEPLLIAHLTPFAVNIIFKGFLLCIAVICVIVLSSAERRRRISCLKNPGIYFFIYLLLQSLLVIYSAHSTLKIAVSGIIYCSQFLFIFMASSLLSSDIESRYVSGLIKFIIVVAFISLAADFMGYSSIFAGKYRETVSVRMGFSQRRGFMPWPNAFATLLVVYSLLLSLLRPNNKLSFFGYFATLATLVRANIVTAFVLFVFSLRSRIVKSVSIVVFMTLILITAKSFLRESVQELGLENADSVYRLAYVVGAFKALKDYPIFGIGVNRLTNRAIWEMDHFYFHSKYSIPTELFGVDMSTSDTNFTFFPEVGCLGTILFAAQLIYFVFLAIKLDHKNYLLFLFPLLLLSYSFPSIIFSYSYGGFYWLIFGNLVAKNREKCEVLTKQKPVLLADGGCC